MACASRVSHETPLWNCIIIFKLAVLFNGIKASPTGSVILTWNIEFKSTVGILYVSIVFDIYGMLNARTLWGITAECP